MSTIPIPALLATLFLLAPQAEREASLRPEPLLQDGLRRVLNAASPEEQGAALEFLRANAGARHERLVPQLFLWLEAAPDTREAMLPGWVLEELDVPAADAVAALVPWLEGEDPTRRAALARVLSQYESPALDRGADFAVYRPFLEREPSLGLVRHLFETDADAALLALTRAQVSDPAELRALLWAWHELADLRWKLRFGFLARAELPRAAPEAVEVLGGLARHARWWARCAAAQLAREEPALRELVGLDALVRDVHPLVRALALAAREPRGR